MELILLERVEKLGQMGDVVTVKNGYARNYLLPRSKARRATKENLEFFKQQKAQLEAANLERRKDAEAVSKKMEGLSVAIIRQAGESGQLYGSVTTRDIAEVVGASGFTIDRHQVILETPVKMLGLSSVRIKLHPEVSLEITLNVARSLEEAEAQLKKNQKAVAAATVEAEPAA